MPCFLAVCHVSGSQVGALPPSCHPRQPPRSPIFEPHPQPPKPPEKSQPYFNEFLIDQKIGNFQPTGEEVARLERPGREPVWALQFAQLLAGADAGGESGAGGSGAEMLLVADWAPSVGFYAHEQGQLVR